MPTYIYRCNDCKSVRDIFKPLSALDRPEECYVCVGSMSRMVAAPAVRADYAGYDCPITGKRIEGKRAHEENLKRHGCRVYEPGETQEAASRRQREEAALETAVEETAEAFVHALPVEKRDQLVVELTHGADTAIVRQ